MKSIPIVVVSDLHVNSTTGLWPPGMTNPDGNEIGLNPVQKFLWSHWLLFVEYVKMLGDVILELNGDLTQGNNRKDSQILTPSTKVMRAAAFKVLEPLIDLPNVKSLYVVKGTEWHEGIGGDEADAIADNFEAVPHPETGTRANWILWLRHEGKLFHFTHHISVSTDSPLTAIRKEIDRAKKEVVDNGMPMPDVQVRSHRHFADAAPDGKYLALVTPGWQLANAFPIKINPIAVCDIGGTVIWVEEGEVRWKFIRYQLPLPTIQSTKP